jgi:hypothetical protein
MASSSSISLARVGGFFKYSMTSGVAPLHRQRVARGAAVGVVIDGDAHNCASGLRAATGSIFLLLPFFAWRYRYGNTASKCTPRWGFSGVLEITAWSGPIIILAVLAFFVWRDAHRLDPYKPLASDQTQLRVQVIGYD